MNIFFNSDLYSSYNIITAFIPMRLWWVGHAVCDGHRHI